MCLPTVCLYVCEQWPCCLTIRHCCCSCLTPVLCSHTHTYNPNPPPPATSYPSTTYSKSTLVLSLHLCRVLMVHLQRTMHIQQAHNAHVAPQTGPLPAYQNEKGTISQVSSSTFTTSDSSHFNLHPCLGFLPQLRARCKDAKAGKKCEDGCGGESGRASGWIFNVQKLTKSRGVLLWFAGAFVKLKPPEGVGEGLRGRGWCGMG